MSVAGDLIQANCCTRYVIQAQVAISNQATVKFISSTQQSYFDNISRQGSKHNEVEEKTFFAVSVHPFRPHPDHQPVAVSLWQPLSIFANLTSIPRTTCTWFFFATTITLGVNGRKARPTTSPFTFFNQRKKLESIARGPGSHECFCQSFPSSGTRGRVYI